MSNVLMSNVSKILSKVATVHMSDEDMDNFVFAMYPKRTASKIHKEFQDLVCALYLSIFKNVSTIYICICFSSTKNYLFFVMTNFLQVLLSELQFTAMFAYYLHV